jgi:hypothetical protein
MKEIEHTIDGWVVMTPQHPSTNEPMIWWTGFREKKSDCIKAFVEDSSLTWRQWKNKFGFRCVRASSSIRLSESSENLKKIGPYEWQNQAIAEDKSKVVLTLPKGAGKGGKK